MYPHQKIDSDELNEPDPAPLIMLSTHRTNPGSACIRRARQSLPVGMVLPYSDELYHQTILDIFCAPQKPATTNYFSSYPPIKKGERRAITNFYIDIENFSFAGPHTLITTNKNYTDLYKIYGHYSDIAVVEKYLAGDDIALTFLINKYLRRLWWIVRQESPTLSDAEDMLQECLFKATQAIHTYQGTASFGTWLHRLVRNHAADKRHKPDKSPDHRTISINEVRHVRIHRIHTEQPIEEYVDLSTIIDVIYQLPTKLRWAIQLVDIAGFEVDYVAKIFNVNVNTIHTRRCRAREKIREILEWDQQQIEQYSKRRKA
ncbi:RNA polymerase sigma factor sigM [Corynebacterium kutscheri]|uniref:DNA-directed RNA polymerase specialized sigma subunit, sigma24 n=1 Tax=Corynebacterium kutscheri TaxID=35755 RepID=A0A0F6R1E9_9CORY|nr:RNA polymerase sigma factor [Corynebacterium kutscheri]AKE42282.1 DNA-directed RNA polymerase specialized sigma subunit, sigma24 [Corynebacterium kutscheri]VEH05614.1 RNA polymerase sigma factor sigM [Corynebacterium kutscheri]VEH10626.1 RNA polymerase sigma factor sigM [Corynebacterium kutscheri]VEH81508.1 RNA polymerase sigma factor sigM [Corynebacterium kutscheri]